MSQDPKKASVSNADNYTAVKTTPSPDLKVSPEVEPVTQEKDANEPAQP